MVRVIPVHAETIQVEGGMAISGEFTGASVETFPPDEGTFSTPPASIGDQLPTTSPETTFRTLPISVHCQGGALTCETTGLSVEGSFTTPPTDGLLPISPPSGGGGSGGGGGSSGGGYGYRLPIPLAPNVALGECPIYLTKFIRFGVDNDPAEVLKLQRFLRDFERMDVPMDGIYGEETFEAVKIFQRRYAEAILKPWGIEYPTGYVFITTTLAINNLYCERDPATTLDLRSRQSLRPANETIKADEATSTPASPFLEMGEATSTNRFLVAALGVFNFFKQISRWWWIIFLLFVLGLTIVARRARNRNGKGP